MRVLWKVAVPFGMVCVLFCASGVNVRSQLQNNSLYVVNPSGTNSNPVPADIYNTSVTSNMAVMGTTMVASAQVAQRNYRFTYYVSQVTVASGCSMTPTVQLILTYTDVNGSAAVTFPFPAFTLATSLGVGSSGTFMFQPKAMGGDIKFSTMLGGSCGTFPTYEVFPVLEAM